jgi:O-antigen ligase
LFENSNVLGNYLAMIFPFLLAIFIFTKEKRTKLFWAISIFLTTACAVLTWSRSAWLAIIISAFIFIFIFTRKAGRLIPFGILAIPYLSFVLPGAIINRFSSIGDIADSSTMYRIYTWKGTFSAIREYFWGGIGFGENAFKAIYPAFSYAGIEAAEHSHNLFLQILLSVGIVGTIFFGLIIFLNIAQNLEYTKNNSADASSKLFLVASFASFIAAIIMGMFDYIWFNYRIFFLFWIVIAISSSYYRVKENEDARKEIDVDYASNSVDTEILL